MATDSPIPGWRPPKNARITIGNVTVDLVIPNGISRKAMVEKTTEWLRREHGKILDLSRRKRHFSVSVESTLVRDPETGDYKADLETVELTLLETTET